MISEDRHNDGGWKAESVSDLWAMFDEALILHFHMILMISSSDLLWLQPETRKCLNISRSSGKLQSIHNSD